MNCNRNDVKQQKNVIVKNDGQEATHVHRHTHTHELLTRDSISKKLLFYCYCFSYLVRRLFFLQALCVAILAPLVLVLENHAHIQFS